MPTRSSVSETKRDADGTGAGVEALDPLGLRGRVRSYESGDQLAYPYAFRDPLGNTRVLAEPDGAGVVQQTAYYTDSSRYSRSRASGADPPRTRSSTTPRS